jgi:hypothetical protein
LGFQNTASVRPNPETVSKKKVIFLLMEKCFFLTYFLIGEPEARAGLNPEPRTDQFRSIWEHYRFFNEKSNSYLSNLKLAIKERVWVSLFFVMPYNMVRTRPFQNGLFPPKP